MAGGSEDRPRLPLTETISFEVNIDILQKSEFQEFVTKLERSQHVFIIINETHAMVIINGKTAAVNTSRNQMEKKIRDLSSGPLVKGTPPGDDPVISVTIELSVAKYNFLDNFGEKIVTSIREQAGIKSASILDGKLQVSGTNAAITKIKSYLEETLYEENLSVTRSMKTHLELTCKGRILREFSKRYRVGTSLQEFRRYDRNQGTDTPKRGLPNGRGRHHANRSSHAPTPNSANLRGKFAYDQRRGSYSRGNTNCGERGGRTLSAGFSITKTIPDLTNLTLNDPPANTSGWNGDDLEKSNRKERYNTKMTDSEDAADQEADDDGHSGQASDSDESVSSNCTTDSFNMKNFNDRAEKPVTVSLCSDSEASLSKAIAELQSYSFNIESWVLSDEELTFILKQQQRGKPPQSSMSIRDRSMQINFYFRHLIQNPFLHIFLYYTRGIWHVKVSGFKSDVHSAVLKIRGYLNDVVDTELQIPISGVMAFFLRRKASSDINRLKNLHNIKIIIFSPRRQDDNTDEDNNDNHCLKLIGPVSRINLAQTVMESFLENLSEKQQDFSCDTWDISKIVSGNIITSLKKIHESDDYEAVGVVKFYNLAIERRQTTPKVTITVVGLNEETAEDVIQQCKHLAEGYVVWKPALDEYRALHNILFVQKRPGIARLQQEWSTNVQLDNETNTVIIPGRSKIIADEIKETLQSLAAGKPNRIASVTVTIPIQFNIRRFVYQGIQPLLEEVKTQRVYIDSKDRNGLTLHGRSEIINSVQEKINTIINDIKQKIVTNRLKLPSIESEFIRADSYQVLTRIERETDTIIRDVRIDAKVSKLDDHDQISSIITCVENNRGQTILVKKGDITKAKDVDAIVNAANGPMNHAGGLDKIISDAAGPALDQECKKLIAKNGGVAISTGKAVKTTAGRLPYKSIIHAIGPQYSDGNQQERPLLFFSVLSSLRIAEQEGYNSIALPAISAVTYGFPLNDCTNIVIRAVKQFFADFPQSNLRKVILLDVDDAACNSFARELEKDHTNSAADNNDDITRYHLPPLTAKWCWQNDYGEEIYDDSHTRQIEAEFQKYNQRSIVSTLKINPDNLTTGTITCYSIHFLPNLRQILTANPYALHNRLVCGYQMREGTDFKRDIIRYPLPLQPNNTSAGYRPKQLDTYHLKILSKEDDWDITGISSAALKQAEIAIRKAIVSATISEPFSINLNEDIDAHKTAVTNIAIQQFIRVDFQQDSTGNLSLILKGFRQNILQAKLQISLYVQDILRMETDKDDQLNIPTEWGDQEEQCQLVKLPNNHPDFIRVEKRIKETIHNVKIDKIERVQNLRLWNLYAFRRRTLQQELRDKPNLQVEMELFHGTGTTVPIEIYTGEFGFDMSFCKQGMWGLGTYFAKNASYSCGGYSHQLSDGKRQVFLAQVLTGDVYECPSDSTLRRTPKKNASVSGLRYNSVSGDTGGSKVYIVYENRVAYPTYLITFTSGDGQHSLRPAPNPTGYNPFPSNPIQTPTVPSPLRPAPNPTGYNPFPSNPIQTPTVPSPLRPAPNPTGYNPFPSNPIQTPTVPSPLRPAPNPTGYNPFPSNPIQTPTAFPPRFWPRRPN